MAGLLGALSDRKFWNDVGDNTYNLAQSASNSAASNVSAPVDLITWLMNKAGANIQKPVGGSDWMTEKGLTRPVQENASSIAGDSLGMIAPMLMAAKAPQIARGLLQAGENMAAPQVLRKESGMAIDPKAQKQLVNGLLGGGNAERYRLGDIKPKQAAEAYNMGGRPIGDSVDVFASPQILEDHARLERMIGENFTAPEVGAYAAQAMRPNSKVFPPLKDGDYPLLTSERMTDPVTGRSYNSEMALKPVDDGFEAVTIIPRGLKARKKP